MNLSHQIRCDFCLFPLQTSCSFNQSIQCNSLLYKCFSCIWHTSTATLFSSACLLLQTLLSVFFAVTVRMCEITHYFPCIYIRGREPPKDKVVRCKEWSELRSKVQKGDANAREQFKLHMESKRLGSVSAVSPPSYHHDCKPAESMSS